MFCGESPRKPRIILQRLSACLLACFPQRAWRSWSSRRAFWRGSTRLSTTPAHQGNTALRLLGGDTTFQRGESGLEMGLVQRYVEPVTGSQEPTACLPGRQREERSALLKASPASAPFQSSTDTWLPLKSSRKSLWFQPPCFKSNARGLCLVGGRETRKSCNGEQMGCVSIQPYIS